MFTYSKLLKTFIICSVSLACETTYALPTAAGNPYTTGGNAGFTVPPAPKSTTPPPSSGLPKAKADPYTTGGNAGFTVPPAPKSTTPPPSSGLPRAKADPYTTGGNAGFPQN